MIDILLGTRATHRAVAPPSETKTLTLTEAYAIQDELREALAGKGERILGWKAGFTGRAAQQTFGIDHPVCGFLLASGGSISTLLRPKAGDVVSARFTRLGTVSARIQ